MINSIITASFTDDYYTIDYMQEKVRKGSDYEKSIFSM